MPSRRSRLVVLALPLYPQRVGGQADPDGTAQTP